MTHPLRTVLSAVLAVALLVGALGQAYAFEPPFRRGASLHSMMNWASAVPPDRQAYLWPPFDDPGHRVPDELLDNLVRAGFDFIRLTVDPGPYLAFEGERRDELDRVLLRNVARLRAKGFGVVVDFHPNSQVRAYDPVRLVQAIDHPSFRSYVELVRRSAGLLGALKDPKVALEPLNEPAYGYDAATARRWNAMQEALHAAVRSVAPDLLVVLTGAQGGNKEGLLAVDPRPFAGSNVLYSFHYYEPHDLTHQGVPAPDLPYRAYLSGLPYPALGAPHAAIWRPIEERIRADESLGLIERYRILRGAQAAVAAYLATGHDRSHVVRDFDLVSGWARRHGIDPRRVFLGEFGITRTYGRYRAADAATLEAWLGDVRREAESRGFAWAIWAVTGYGGMALVETDDTTVLHAGTLRALGLRPAGEQVAR